MAAFVAALLIFSGCGLMGVTLGDDAEGAPDVTEERTTTVAESSTQASTALVETIEDAEIDYDLLNTAKDAADAAPPVATVAGRPITQSEYRYMLNMYKSSLMLNSGIEAGTDEDVNFWIKRASGGKTRLDEAREKVLSELRRIKVCASVAESRGITLDNDELENISTYMRSQETRFGGREAFEDVLNREYGVSLAEYWSIVELTTLRDKLLEIEKASVAISEEDIRRFYDENQDIYGDTSRLRQILLLSDGIDPRESRSADDAKKLADEIAARIEAGEDMALLAGEYSDDPDAIADGGERIVTKADQMLPENIVEWAFMAPIGETAVFETAFGCYVVRIEGRTAGNYGEAITAIEDRLRDAEIEKRVAQWLKDSANVLIIDEKVIKDLI